MLLLSFVGLPDVARQIEFRLARFHSRYWFLFTAFVGLNLLQSAFTRWCLMEDILAALGVAKKSGCDREHPETNSKSN